MVRLDIKPGDVLFVRGSGFIPEIIEYVTHGPSHAAMFVDTNRLEEAQGGRPLGEIDLSFYLDGKTKLEVWEDDSLTDSERAKMVSFAHTLYGEKYDYMLIPLEFLHFECGLPLGWYHHPNSDICSTDIYDVAAHVGHIWSKVPNPAPVDLLHGEILKKKFDLQIPAVQAVS